MTSGARSMRMPPAIRQEAFYRLLWTRLFLATPLTVDIPILADRQETRSTPVHSTSSRMRNEEEQASPACSSSTCHACSASPLLLPRLQRRLRRRQPRDRHAERRAAHVIQPDLVAELDTVRL